MQVFSQVPKVARYNSPVLKQLTVVVLMVEFVVLLVVSFGGYRSVWDHVVALVSPYGTVLRVYSMIPYGTFLR